MAQDKLLEMLKQLNNRLKKGENSTMWDNYVPIVQDEKTSTAFLTNEISDPYLYNELCHKLICAKDNEEFILIINSPGGVLDSAFMIVDAIKSSKAHIRAHLSGTVASAATIITLSCDDIEIADHTTWMSHNYSAGGISGKGHELKARQNFIDRLTNKSFREIHKGFFSSQEIEDIIEGKDIWLDSSEVNERWTNMKKYTKE